MVSLVTAAWRAISLLRSLSGTSAQRMRLNNEALYLSHRLAVYSKETSIAAEVGRLSQCGNTWYTQELVFPLGSC
jgi:hypothetical protein